MPSKYVRKTCTSYTKEDLLAAAAAVKKNEGTVTAIAKVFKIPRQTLADHVKSNWLGTEKRPVKKGRTDHVGAGRPRELTDFSSEYLVHGIQHLGKLGWPLEPGQIPKIVKKFLDLTGQPSRFKNNLPGKDWCRGFLNQYSSQLSIRKPEYVTVARAKGLTQGVLNDFFKILGDLVDELGIRHDPSRFYNLDETGLSLDPKLKRCLFSKGLVNAQSVVPCEGKTQYSVLFCGNASGQYLPPYVIYKAKGNALYHSWVEGAPEGTAFNVTSSGWMEDQVFESWFEKIFLKFLIGKPKPIVLIFDGHGSHITWKTAVKALHENVHIVCLPPHSSGALQPLDVGVFANTKRLWAKKIKLFYDETRAKQIKKEHFAHLLSSVYKEGFLEKPEYIIAGFRKCGIYPLDINAVPQDKILPSTVLEVPLPFVNETSSTTSCSSSGGEQLGLAIPSTSSSCQQDPVPVCEITPHPSVLDRPISSASSQDIGPAEPMTPRKAMREAIVSALRPELSASTRKALAASAKKRARCQKKVGEVLTREDTIKRLKAEELEREAKRKNVNRVSKKKKSKINDSICYECMSEDPPVEDSEESEDDADVDWIECEYCSRWFHLSCVEHRPSKKVCQYCHDE